MTLVPTRLSFNVSISVFENLGLGSRLNAMLHVAAVALQLGFGFHLSHHACPTGTRQSLPCFWEPASRCGGEPVHMCSSPLRVGPSCYSGRVVSALSSEPVRKALHQAFYRLSRTSVCDALARAEQPASAPIPACTESNLAMWRAVARLVLRPQQSVRERILSQWLPHAGLSTQELVSGSYAALHIRRGDKGSEARLRPTCDYAKALARLLARRRLPQPAALFVATDGPEVLDELRACASFGGGSRGKRPRLHSLIELAGIPTRGMSDASFARIWTEVEILVGAQVVVGTFSSNVGRLVRAGRALAALS